MATVHHDPNTTPAMPAPHGQVSNLINPPSQTWPTILCLALSIGLSGPFVGIRLYTRWTTRKLWWDDWTCLLGWVFLVAFAGLLIQSINYGGCHDLWNVSKADYKKFTKHFHNIEIVARVGMFFTKAAILLFYQRLFVVEGTRGTKFWWAIWFVFWWNLLYAIALVLAVAFECTGKGQLVAEGKECVDEFAVLICASVINVITDLVILVIPICAIWGLQMPRGKKWRLSAVFAVGVLGVAASVARLAYQMVYAGKPNQTIIVMILSDMNAAEQFMGILVCCMPLLPSFYRHLHNKLTDAEPSRSGKLIRGISASLFGRGSGVSKSSKRKPRDPYQIYSTRGYEDIEDAETGRGSNGLGGIVKGTEMSVISERRSNEPRGGMHVNGAAGMNV